MEMFTVRDLRNGTGELIRTAELGHLSLISKHGQPVFVVDTSPLSFLARFDFLPALLPALKELIYEN